jgi:cytidylate kinase
MIITIDGKKGEGKTTLVKNICKGKKVSFINECSLVSKFWTCQLDNDTDIIVIDEVKHFNKTYSIFSNAFLTIENPQKEPFVLNMPDVILVRLNESQIKGMDSNKVACPKCKSQYITFTEHEHYECNSCCSTWL